MHGNHMKSNPLWPLLRGCWVTFCLGLSTALPRRVARLPPGGPPWVLVFWGLWMSGAWISFIPASCPGGQGYGSPHSLADHYMEKPFEYKRADPHRLIDSGLSKMSYNNLAAALQANPSHVSQLDLRGNNNLQDPEVRQLCVLLRNPQCQLETLRLEQCGLSGISCNNLAAALQANPSHLRVLILRGNYSLQATDLDRLRDLKESPHFSLETLFWIWH
ncbi:unnamed protein product [Oreochromis niloticus]|nr:unnamed protein product [Mustela putorius furo]